MANFFDTLQILSAVRAAVGKRRVIKSSCSCGSGDSSHSMWQPAFRYYSHVGQCVRVRVLASKWFYISGCPQPLVMAVKYALVSQANEAANLICSGLASGRRATAARLFTAFVFELCEHRLFNVSTIGVHVSIYSGHLHH